MDRSRRKEIELDILEHEINSGWLSKKNNTVVNAVYTVNAQHKYQLFCDDFEDFLEGSHKKVRDIYIIQQIVTLVVHLALLLLVFAL